MASGAEHYAIAEALIHTATDELDVARAQVHATLALAAATAYPAVKDYCGDEATEPREWTTATDRQVSA